MKTDEKLRQTMKNGDKNDENSNKQWKTAKTMKNFENWWNTAKKTMTNDDKRQKIIKND